MPIVNRALAILQEGEAQFRKILVSNQLVTVLKGILALLSCGALLFFVITVKLRISYAFQYNWIEDGLLACVRHLRDGLPLYEQPHLGYTPYLYTPLYLYVAAALSKIVGISFLTLRLVSVVATLGCFGIVYAIVYAETRGRLAALTATGLFAASYAVLGGWFDLGRVDMLYMFFFLAALYATRWMNPAVAALLWVCAFQTKQGVLPIALIALCHTWRKPRRILIGVGSFSVLLAGSVAWLNHQSGGWYNYYVFGLSSGLPIDKSSFLRLVTSDFLGSFGIAILVIVAAFLVTSPSLRNQAASFYFLNSISILGFCCYLRIHHGASINALLPAYAMIAVLFGVALARLIALLERGKFQNARPVLVLLLFASALQIVMHVYTPRRFAPLAEDVIHRREFEDQLRAIPGDVLIPGFPEDAAMAGKREYASAEATGAVIDANRRGEGDNLLREYASMVEQERLGAVVVDETAEVFWKSKRSWLPRNLLLHYPIRIPAIGAEDTRYGLEPRWIYLPCRSADFAEHFYAQADLSACKEASTADHR